MSSAGTSSTRSSIRSARTSGPAGLRRRRFALATFLILAIVSVTAPSAGAAGTATTADGPARALHVVSESASYCARSGLVDFRVKFDHQPDFRAVDEFGRRRDSFQYAIVGDSTLPFPQNYDAIIRGDELTMRGSTGLLPIRRSGPSDPDPAAGGWGAVRAVVPVRLRGSVLTFSAPLSALSDHSTDGRFSYELGTFSFGAQVDFITNESRVERR
jgi:hypothetical protein